MAKQGLLGGSRCTAILGEAVMNTLDIESRAKVNKIHLDEMHADARNRQLVRGLQPSRTSAIPKVRIHLMLFALVLVLFVAFFIAATPAI